MLMAIQICPSAMARNRRISFVIHIKKFKNISVIDKLNLNLKSPETTALPTCFLSTIFNTQAVVIPFVMLWLQDGRYCSRHHILTYHHPRARRTVSFCMPLFDQNKIFPRRLFSWDLWAIIGPQTHFLARGKAEEVGTLHHQILE